MGYLGRLNRFVQSSVDSNGNASCTLTANEDWIIDLTVVALDTAVTSSIARVYLGSAQPSTLIAQSQVGYGDSNDTRLFVVAGESLTFTWTGSSGATNALARVIGTMYRPGSGYLYWNGGQA